MRARPFESVLFHALAPLEVRPRYHRVREVGVVARGGSGYCAVVLLGLSVDQTVAPLTGSPLVSTTDAESYRIKSTLPRAAGGRSGACQSASSTGTWAVSIVSVHIAAVCWLR